VAAAFKPSLTEETVEFIQWGRHRYRFIDPQRDVDIYLDVARDKGLTRISSPDIMNSQHAPERASISATAQARSSRT
jgi:hypothetical protein